MAKKKRSSSRAPARELDAVPISFIKLARLQLDTRNPRFGGEATGRASEKTVLDTIVEKFGVDDLLSSISVNGYLDAEPLVGRLDEKAKTVKVAEGNRRLTACLILAGDPRAENQGKRTEHYRALQKKHGQPAIDELPVRVFNDQEFDAKVLPYLGVRHIAGALPWDSYAKAHWIAQVRKSGEQSLDEIAEMIGDANRTVARMLEGYYFVNQLIEKGRFNPSDSERAGRGSNPLYPFSWVYTTLGYSPVRSWLDLNDLSEDVKPNPVAKDHLDDAQDLMTFLFGNKSEEKRSSITDSRQISQLAAAISEPTRRAMLKRGKSAQEANDSGRPPSDRVAEQLLQARESLSQVTALLDEGRFSPKLAAPLREPSRAVKALASTVSKKIEALCGDEEGDE